MRIYNIYLSQIIRNIFRKKKLMFIFSHNIIIHHKVIKWAVGEMIQVQVQVQVQVQLEDEVQDVVKVQLQDEVKVQLQDEVEVEVQVKVAVISGM
jgi:hypothetical protein